MAEAYEVEQGECIGSIAYEHGFFWQTLWDDPHNAKLKQRRKDSNVLKEGDVVHIPDLTLRQEFSATEQLHRFQLKGVPAKLRVRVLQAEEAASPEPRDWDEEFEPVDPPEPPPPPAGGGKPRANASYRLCVDGVWTSGTTKSDGLIECSIPPNAMEARLVLDPGTAKETVTLLKLGHLDPVEEVSGVQARLNNLGFSCGPVDGVLGPRTRRALKGFQGSAGLEATGDLDDKTRQKLRQTHEST
jgi:N-acetylmuramoyl-L-alanine amidase